MATGNQFFAFCQTCKNDGFIDYFIPLKCEYYLVNVTSIDVYNSVHRESYIVHIEHVSMGIQTIQLFQVKNKFLKFINIRHMFWLLFYKYIGGNIERYITFWTKYCYFYIHFYPFLFFFSVFSNLLFLLHILFASFVLVSLANFAIFYIMSIQFSSMHLICHLSNIIVSFPIPLYFLYIHHYIHKYCKKSMKWQIGHVLLTLLLIHLCFFCNIHNSLHTNRTTIF